MEMPGLLILGGRRRQTAFDDAVEHAIRHRRRGESSPDASPCQDRLDRLHVVYGTTGRPSIVVFLSDVALLKSMPSRSGQFSNATSSRFAAMKLARGIVQPRKRLPWSRD